MPTPSPRSSLTPSLVELVARKAGRTPETATAAGRRVLLIESAADGGEALSALLEVWGHKPMVAATGRQGVQRAIRESPDVIILNLDLHDMDGCEVVRLIRDEPTRAVPVIIAYSDYHRREAGALHAGCDAFVLKPAVDELEALVSLPRDQVRRHSAYVGHSRSTARSSSTAKRHALSASATRGKSNKTPASA